MIAINRMNKKGDIPVTLLVLMALFLTAWATFIFLTHSDSLETKIRDAKQLDRVNVKEMEIDFYIGEIIDNGIKGMNRENSKGEFVSNIKKELLKYKNETGFIIPELAQVEEQINEENVNLFENRLEVSLKLNIVESLDKVSFLYGYDKKFARELK